jgi:hypothetical protein
MRSNKVEWAGTVIPGPGVQRASLAAAPSDATEASELLQYSFVAATIVRSLRACDLMCLPPKRMPGRSPRERSHILQPTAEKRNQRGRLQDAVTYRLRFKRQ